MSSTILLADDSLTIQKVVELTFADTDYEVVAVSGGEELLQKLPECRPDLVICDIIMPGQDGYDVCQEIKSDPDTLHIPVILLTGTFEPFDRDRALAAGCSDIITKPFEARRLVETVERLLHGGPAETAPVASEGDAAPAPIPLAEEAVDDGTEDFGTRLSGAAPADADSPTPFAGGLDADDAMPDEGLDFTATGFAEMEEAGRAQAELVPPPPEHGLEFEAEAPESVAEAAEPAGEPFADLPAAEPTDQEGEAEEAFEPAEPSVPVSEDAAAPAESAEDVGEEAAGAPAPDTDDLEAPFGPADMPPPAPPQPEEPVDASTDPTMTVPIESYVPPKPPSITDDFDVAAADEAPQVEPVAEPVPDDIAEPELEEPEPEESAWAEPAETTEPEPVEGAWAEPADTTEPEPEEGAEPKAEARAEVQPSLADTAPLAAAVEPPTIAAEPVTMHEDLSETDIDRIARRVIELAADRIERIAWEVIPDMAEIVVRERIHELETDVEQEAQPGDDA